MTKLIKPKILTVSTVAKSQLFEVEQVELRFANGEQRFYERLKNNGYGAVMIIPITYHQEMILIQEYAVGTERYELGFPKGAIDYGETPEQAALRELQEEIGQACHKLTFLREIISSPNFGNSRMFLFLAEDLYPSVLIGDEPEPLIQQKIPLAQLNHLLASFSIAEAKNLCALYSLRDYLGKLN